VRGLDESHVACSKNLGVDGRLMMLVVTATWGTQKETAGQCEAAG
jgi:hypothetical protein